MKNHTKCCLLRKNFFCPSCGKKGVNNISSTCGRKNEQKIEERFYVSCEEHGLFIIERNENLSI